MATQKIVCRACEAAVPYGRLSCPACGELLASVAAGRRVAVASVPETRTPTALPPVLYDVDDAPRMSVVDGQLALDPPVRLAGSELPWADIAALDDATDDDSGDDTDEDLDPSDGRPAYRGQLFQAPGAYVPPQPVSAMLAGPVGPARTWAGSANPPEYVDSTPVDARATAASGPTDATRISEFVGWLSVAGGALSAVGFLLPWSNISVIGASGVGYFDRWGIAGPGHVLVALGLLVVLALTMIRNPVPVWMRVGLPGLGFGALLIGLVWPYLFGPLGAGAGVVIVAVGAVLLGVAGVLALVTDRHARADRAV